MPVLWSFWYGRPSLEQYDFPGKAHARRPQVSTFYRRFGLNFQMELEQKPVSGSRGGLSDDDERTWRASVDVHNRSVDRTTTQTATPPPTPPPQKKSMLNNFEISSKSDSKYYKNRTEVHSRTSLRSLYRSQYPVERFLIRPN